MNSPAKKVLVIVVVLVLFALTILIVDSKLPRKGKDKENPTKTEEVIEEKEETKSKNKEDKVKDKVKDTEENKKDEEIREAEATILSKSGGTISLSVDDEEVTKVLRFDMNEEDYKTIRVGQILHLKYAIKNGEVEVKEVTFK